MRFASLCWLAAGLLAAPALADDIGYDPRAAFAEADGNRDGAIDAQEMLTRTTELFYLGDTDKNGSLDVEELRRVVVVEERYTDTDTNRDGKISLHEFVRTRMAIFDEADTNKDGVLNVDEVVDAYEIDEGAA
jgi:Ca2+-binding EF-hand superfamily protein